MECDVGCYVCLYDVRIAMNKSAVDIKSCVSYLFCRVLLNFWHASLMIWKRNILNWLLISIKYVIIQLGGGYLFIYI